MECNSHKLVESKYILANSRPTRCRPKSTVAPWNRFATKPAQANNFPFFSLWKWLQRCHWNTSKFIFILNKNNGNIMKAAFRFLVKWQQLTSICYTMFSVDFLCASEPNGIAFIFIIFILFISFEIEMGMGIHTFTWTHVDKVTRMVCMPFSKYLKTGHAHTVTNSFNLNKILK